MDRRTDQHADERNSGQPVNGFRENSPICWLAIEARSRSIPGAAAQAPRQELIDAFATASRRTLDGTPAMKDRSVALFFRSETKQERAPWVEGGRSLSE
jgi:hypothetical protein